MCPAPMYLTHTDNTHNRTTGQYSNKAWFKNPPICPIKNRNVVLQ